MPSSSTSGTPEGDLPPTPFLRLPLEIASLMAAKYLSPCDWKSLRLACSFYRDVPYAGANKRRGPASSVIIPLQRPP
jgi:hypothetical protein